MAYAKPRENGRWTAIYTDLDGFQKSAGTYDTQYDAEQIAKAQEVFLRDQREEGRLSPAQRAQMTIEEYWLPWLKSHRVEASTKKGYAGAFRAHILPAFGEVRVRDLTRQEIRDYLAEIKDNGGGVATQRQVRAVLSAMMQTASEDGYRNDNPARGVRVDKRTRKKITVMQTDEFGKIFKALPNEGARVFAEVVLNTGCRIDEATILTPADWNPETRVFHFSKALQDAGAEFNNGVRFKIAETKTHEWRDVTIGKKAATRVDKWIADNGFGDNDLMFPADLIVPKRIYKRATRVETPEGQVESPNGKKYDHGTMGGYITAKCRCDACRQWSRDYAQERAAKKGKTVKARMEHPYLNDDNWREVWKKACKDAKIGWAPTAYQLRHTSGSWLLAAGESVQKVRERYGHASLETTSLYIHHVADDGSSGDILDDVTDWDE